MSDLFQKITVFQRSDVKQFAADWNSWNGRNPASSITSATPSFYHAALMTDAVTLFTSTLQCRLQQMDAQRANASLNELATVAHKMHQQPPINTANAKVGAKGQSICYLSGKLMYQHGAYQMRSLGAIAELRKNFVAEDAGDGCEDMGLRGLTGDLRTCVEEREAGELVLWSAMGTTGLQPVARVLPLILNEFMRTFMERVT